jgi:outer membrane protein assembly factor BamB
MLVLDSVLFVATTNRQVFAFATRNGRKYWDHRLEGEVPADLVGGNSALYLATAEWNGQVHARAVERGRMIWKHPVGPTSHSPLLDDNIIYQGTDNGWVYALKASTGDQVWRTRVSGSVAATPVSFGDAIIIAAQTDTLYRLTKKDGSISARAHLEAGVAAPMAISGDVLVLPTYGGAVVGISATTLRSVWRVDTGAPVLAAPAVGADGTIHVINRNAEIWRISAGHGARVAQLGGTVGSSFTLLSNRYVIGRIDGSLLITDLNGHVVAEHKFNDSVAAPVAALHGALYVPLRHGGIVKLQ